MTNSICNSVEIDKQELIKVHNQLIEIVQTIYRLKDDAMSADQYYETLQRLQKRAQLASQRFGQLVGKHITIFDRMEAEHGRYINQ